MLLYLQHANAPIVIYSFTQSLSVQKINVYILSTRSKEDGFAAAVKKSFGIMPNKSLGLTADCYCLHNNSKLNWR